jgi:hypothetical protein
MPLTDTAVKKAKAGARPIKLSDAKGMYLLVNPTGSKLWRWKYRVLGKEKVMALGAYPDVSLAQAREATDNARKVLAAGDDPMVKRKADKHASLTAAANSFESVALKWWAHWSPSRTEQHAGQVRRRFQANVFPHIGARWSEFDLKAGRWDIPAERMKMKTPHIVPLSSQAVNILKTLQLVSGHGALVFPGERDHEKPMSNNTILGALKRMGYKGRMTGHGFRGIASTLLHEMGFNHAHIELQLAHQERDAVSAAYNHATYLKERAKLMQHWADYLDNCTTGKVLTFRRAA